jgi:hypothetical protein
VKAQGSAYVAIVFAALIGYFGYQWWYNPARAVKQRLGEIAGLLSIPENEADMARISRLAKLRGFLADDIYIHAGSEEIRSRDTAVALAAAWKPARAPATFTSPTCRCSSNPRARPTPTWRWS